MVFHPPAWVPKLPFSPPDSIPICDFIFDEKYGRQPYAQSRQPYTCSVTGRGYSAAQVRDRVQHLARGLAKELGFSPNQGTEWDKVVGIFSVNTVSAAEHGGDCH